MPNRKILVAPSNTSVHLQKTPTEIAGLDDLTLGGLPAGRPTLLCGAAGCGKTLFGMTFLVNGVDKFDEAGVFMSFEEREEDLAANVHSLGFDIDELIAKKKLVVDYVRIERAEIEESGEYDLEGLFVRLGHAIETVGAKRVVLDTIEALFSGLADSTILRAELRRLFGWLKDKGRDGDHHCGTWGRSAHAIRNRRVCFGLRDSARQSRPGTGRHAPPARRQVPGLSPRDQ